MNKKNSNLSELNGKLFNVDDYSDSINPTGGTFNSVKLERIGKRVELSGSITTYSSSLSMKISNSNVCPRNYIYFPLMAATGIIRGHIDHDGNINFDNTVVSGGTYAFYLSYEAKQ